MTRLHYISPSVLPSRAANAVHVLLQCDGLVNAGAEVTLYAKRSIADAAALPAALQAGYGVDVGRLRLVTCHGRSTRGDTLRIAALALRHTRKAGRYDAVLSRNLYAAYVHAVLWRRPLLYETHQLELGPRKPMQRAIMTRDWVKTVAISRRLVDHLDEHHGVEPAHPLVLHDAAPAGFERLEPATRRAALTAVVGRDLSGWDGVCGYFGHLYAGRGIEVIEAMAARRPRCLFLVYGGNDADVAARQAASPGINLCFMGHVPHPVARRAMVAVDVLLMPYQQSVSIGLAGHDTARWMSPMKMFEYLAAGVPVISSDLPVLREVLVDGVNCLLAPADDAPAWVAALDRLIAEPSFAASLGARAHAQYLGSHSWTHRAQALLAAAQAS